MRHQELADFCELFVNVSALGNGLGPLTASIIASVEFNVLDCPYCIVDGYTGVVVIGAQGFSGCAVDMNDWKDGIHVWMYWLDV